MSFTTSPAIACAHARPIPARKRRVLLVAPYAPCGGGMGRLMAYLLRDDPRPGIEFRRIESRGGGPAAFSVWFVFAAILRIAAAPRDTIVHVNMAERISVWRKGAILLAARLAGLPTILHLHAADIVEFHGRLPAWGRFLMRRIFQSATVCIVLGEHWKIWVADAMCVPAARIVLLRNGVPRPRVDAVPRSGAVIRILFLGNLLPRKGLQDLLAALGDRRFRTQAWHLTIAGDGPDQNLRAQCEALEITPRVHLLGWQSRAQTEALLAATDLLVLPSYKEGLPLVLLEAAGLGIPIITTPIGAIPEVFEDGVSALLVPPGDTASLADALLRIMCDPALATRLGENARQLYNHHFALDRFADALTDIYEQHCRQRRAA